MQLHQAGRLDEAEALYRRLLDANPRHADALHMMGLLNAQRRRFDEAARFIGQALMQLPGEVCTELDAIALLTGASARIISAGGIYGAEGSVWVTLTGADAQVDAAAKLVADASTEPPCRI